MSKQKTAIQQLIQFLEIYVGKSNGSNPIAETAWKIAIQQARELDAVNKQQIIDGHFNGKVDKQPDNYIGKERTGEQYFNETFESHV